jgi:hypothetical protein
MVHAKITFVMKNMADPQFVVVDSVVTLNLPDGLSLAPTYAPQTLLAGIGDIAGGEEVSYSWIVRGDEPGEYDLSVDFDGTLMPFQAPIESRVLTGSPLSVNGVNWRRIPRSV